MQKKVLTVFPPRLLEQIDAVAQIEHRSRSDLIREATRRYIAPYANVLPKPRITTLTIVPDVVPEHTAGGNDE